MHIEVLQEDSCLVKLTELAEDLVKDLANLQFRKASSQTWQAKQIYFIIVLAVVQGEVNAAVLNVRRLKSLKLPAIKLGKLLQSLACLCLIGDSDLLDSKLALLRVWVSVRFAATAAHACIVALLLGFQDMSLCKMSLLAHN